jgi:hypothetical protein
MSNKKDQKSITYKLKIKALILFERVTGKPFEINTTEDLYVYFYCVRCVNIDNYDVDFDKFLDECDDNPDMFTDFCNQLEKHNNCQSNLSK